MRPYPSCVYWRLCAYMMEMIATSFSLFTAYQILSCYFYFQGALHTAITGAVYCVKLVASDRRVTNKVQQIIRKMTWQIRFSKLKYNTCGGRNGAVLFSDHIFWPCNLLCDWPHNYRRFPSGRPHAAVGVFLFYSLYFSSLPTELFWEALLHLKMMTTYHFLGHGFDHIFDHKRIRSTRR